MEVNNEEFKKEIEKIKALDDALTAINKGKERVPFLLSEITNPEELQWTSDEEIQNWLNENENLNGIPDASV